MFLLFLLLLIVAVLAALLYLFVFFREVPDSLEERVGRSAPAEPVGVWQPDRASSRGRAALAEGQLRETRLWELDSGFGRPRLVRQVRYRDHATNEIVRVDADEVVKRQRARR